MIELVQHILNTQPILAVFLAIGVGSLVVRSTLAGSRSASERFCSSAWPSEPLRRNLQIAGPIGLIGLTMFLYGIGILYGRQFFEGLGGTASRKCNLLALVGVLAGLVVAFGA